MNKEIHNYKLYLHGCSPVTKLFAMCENPADNTTQRLAVPCSGRVPRMSATSHQICRSAHGVLDESKITVGPLVVLSVSPYMYMTFGWDRLQENL